MSNNIPDFAIAPVETEDTAANNNNNNNVQNNDVKQK